MAPSVATLPASVPGPVRAWYWDLKPDFRFGDVVEI